MVQPPESIKTAANLKTIAKLETEKNLNQPAKNRIVAVMDIGVTSIRMAVAEIHSDQSVTTLDTLVQGVDLGRDVFKDRRISRSSIEKAAEILTGYQKVLMEYGVTSQSDIRVVATSAVREANNALSFTDRIFVATGLRVEILDAAEVNRMTYMGIVPQLRQEANLSDGKNVVIEVGGGTTEMLVIRSESVLHSESYRLGSLRSMRALERFRANTFRGRSILEGQIQKTVSRMAESVRRDTAIDLVALGGDVRFATRQIVSDWDGRSLVPIPVSALSSIADTILKLEVDEVVRRYDTNFVEAETLGAALLVHQIIAREFELTHIYVSGTNLRDGLLRETAGGGQYSGEFQMQIIRAAISLGRRYSFDEMHARNVAELARTIFQQTSELHRLNERHEILLVVASLLHEIGLLISTRSNHKHSLYLIRNSEIFGMSASDILLVGLVARYHRRAYPQPSHDGFSTLAQEERVAVAKMASILRLAIALDDRRMGRIQTLHLRREGKQIILSTPDVEDVSLEQISMRENSGLFRDVFGLTIQLRGAQNQ